MGCSGSKPATDEERQEICKFVAKDLLLICVDDALKDPDKVKILAPSDSLQKIKEACVNIREAAAKLVEKGEEEGEEENSSGGMFGGMLGGLLDKAQDLVEEGMDKASELGCLGTSKAMNGLASGMEASVAKVETPFSTIGQELITAKKADIIQVLKETIKADSTPVDNAAKLCLDPDQPNAIANNLLSQGDVWKGVVDKLLPISNAAVDKHNAVEAWDNVIISYNKACDQIAKMLESMKAKVPALESFEGPSRIELDIKKYICEEAAKEIGRLMGEGEASRRQTPERLGQVPDTFLKVFMKEKNSEGKEDLLSTGDLKSVQSTKEQNKK